MSKDFLEKREQGLEYGYFHEQEQKLIAKLHERMDQQTHKAALRETTPIKDESLLDHLVELGVHANTINALSVLPLIFVAWGDGSLHDSERATVLDAAKAHGMSEGSEGWMLLVKWLENKPDQELLDLWKDYISAIAGRLTPGGRELLKADLLAHARAVAEASGGLLGFAPVSPSEKTIMHELEEAFG